MKSSKLNITATISDDGGTAVAYCHQLPVVGTGKNRNEAVKNMICCLHSMIDNAGNTLTDTIDALVVDESVQLPLPDPLHRAEQ